MGRVESASSPPMECLSGNAKTIPEFRGWGPRRTIDLWIRRRPNSRISEWSNAGRSNPNQQPSESRFDTKGIEKTKRITELITSPLTRVVSYQVFWFLGDMDISHIPMRFCRILCWLYRLFCHFNHTVPFPLSGRHDDLWLLYCFRKNI